jgi:transposase
LIPGKLPDEDIQREFASFLYSMYDVAMKDENQILLFLDPMHQIHNNENDYAWQQKGKGYTKQVKANTGRRRINIVGALNPVSLEPTAIITEKNCTEGLIQALLTEIKKQYKNADTISIILDNARYQRAYSVQRFADSLDINLVFLPPYAPNLNLIERLWKFFKRKVIKNKYYPDFKGFEDAIFNFFENYDIYINELKALLNFKFGIIKAI